MSDQLKHKPEADALVKGLAAEWSDPNRCYRLFGEDPSATPAEGKSAPAIAVAEVAAQQSRVSVRIRKGVKVGKPFTTLKGGTWGASVVVTDANRAAVRKVLEGLKPVTRAPRASKPSTTKKRQAAARKAATGPVKVTRLTKAALKRRSKDNPLGLTESKLAQAA